MKKYLNRIFIDGLGGMTIGFFATLIIGTIIRQIGVYIPGIVGETLMLIGSISISITGAGIGVGVAIRLKASPFVTIAAGVAGMVGAFANRIVAGQVIQDIGVVYTGPGEPLGAFLAAFVAVEIGSLVAGKTKVDLIVTPFVTIISGAIVGLLIGPPISQFMYWIGELINWSTEQNPIVMGILVAVIMGMVLTGPLSSAALAIILNLSGLAAGAATIGCAANMMGFATASYKENKLSGFISQGFGTSMLQLPNVIKKPIIWIPAILTSAILGPIGTAVLGMTNNATGAGMGTSGLVGPLMTWQTMTAYQDGGTVFLKIILMHFILPAVLTLIFATIMRKRNWIKDGDMKLNL